MPKVYSPEWVQPPVDAFILAKMESLHFYPSKPADKAKLFRRLHFDLIGLPPTPEDVERFLKDDSPEAYGRWVDRLLASPAYGERWARHWLDVVRYADSAGYEIDDFYDHAYLYRDYVIESFNADKPFDRFIQEQLAGDEMRPDSIEAKIATGFATVGPYAFEGGIGRPNVVEYQRLTDLTDTTGSAFLGLTVGCARCHDHKFDPISHSDYFGLQAIFAPSKNVKVLFAEKNPKSPNVVTLANQPKAPKTHLLKRGEIEVPREVVPPGFPAFLPGGGAIDNRPADEAGRRRTALAKWITATKNPLTARVLANRIWQWHFGQGIVRTPNDFGTQGEPPTHPELLDYLATELRTHRWSLKHLHKLIVLSSTYRTSGPTDRRTLLGDPENRFLARFPRRRLEAEAVWDNLHAVSGTINRARYGPAVYVPIDKELAATKFNLKWDSDKDKAQWTRRGIYLVVRRSLTHPFFENFNVGLSVASLGNRDSTVVAAQSLELLNGPIAVEQARAFAGRLLRECGNDPPKCLARAWLLAFGRAITD